MFGPPDNCTYKIDRMWIVPGSIAVYRYACSSSWCVFPLTCYRTEDVTSFVTRKTLSTLLKLAFSDSEARDIGISSDVLQSIILHSNLAFLIDIATCLEPLIDLTVRDELARYSTADQHEHPQILSPPMINLTIR